MPRSVRATPSAGKPLRQVELFPRPAPESTRLPTAVPAVQGHPPPPRRLWLALRLPSLPLECTPAVPGGDTARVALEILNGRPLVTHCDPLAHEQGIRPGMTLAAAHALAPRLSPFARDPGRERDALERLALRLGRYTPAIAVEMPETLLLEIAASLRLFGGFGTLLDTLRREVEGRGHHLRLAAAPSAAAARLLAHARAPSVEAREQLHARLAPLPLRHLELEERSLTRLHGMGVRRIGELLRLPRDALARRFGPALLLYLDRLLAREPEVLPLYVPPPHFHASHPLAAECENHALLMPPILALIQELAAFAAARARGVQGFTLRLLHHRRPATRCPVVFTSPTRDPERMARVTRERLARVELPAPVLEVALDADRLLPLPGRDARLFVRDEGGDTHWGALAERLASRLGEGGVRGIRCHADHRPEAAWRPAPPGTPSDGGRRWRPLWLLPEPLPLASHGGVPRHRGPLTLVRGPERIASGWWEGEGMTRDYYAALNRRGERLWIYRDGKGEWFMQGLFG